MAAKGKGSMTVEEAGRLGGAKVASERGREFYEEIGRKGGEKGGQRVRELIERGRRRE
jgi:general stress protein YciG